MKPDTQGSMTSIYVRPGGHRPDFRLVITFLWGDEHNCDTDGDSDHPASREWTELYCKNRENPAEVFDVEPVRAEPLTLKVRAERAYLAARVAYFLVVETGGTWADSEVGTYRGPSELESQLGTDFSLPDATKRARDSAWRGATPENPYPNIEDGT